MSLVTDVTNFPGGINQGQGVAAQLGAVIAATLADIAAASANRFVVSVNMANGSYTLANSGSADGLARNVVATITAVTGNDTPGTILVTGLNVADEVISETITLVAAGTATGVKAFKTITSIVQSGWTINTGNDTIVIGTGNRVGLPFKVANTNRLLLSVLGATVLAPTVTAASTLEGSTIDASSGTYDGAKDLTALFRV